MDRWLGGVKVLVFSLRPFWDIAIVATSLALGTEIIRLVEESHLPAKKTLEKLGIPRSTFYRWLDRLHSGGPEALADRPSRSDRIWNRVPEPIREAVVDMALELPELSPRELAVRFTDEKRYFVSESSVCHERPLLVMVDVTD